MSKLKLGCEKFRIFKSISEIYELYSNKRKVFTFEN